MRVTVDTIAIKQTDFRAGFGRPRLRIDPASIVVVLLLAFLFAAAISSALPPYPPRDALQAAFEGGL